MSVKKLVRYCSVLTVAALAWSLNACHTARQGVAPKLYKNPNGRNDTWGFTGIGGGGAMFHPTVSPHDPSFALINCDMGGGYVTYNAGDSWRMFNLHGQVQFYTFDPVDSNTVYANTIGLFKSTDKGNTWRLIYPDPSEITRLVSKGDHAEEMFATKDSSTRRVLALAIDPQDPRKLYAGIRVNGAAGLYLSHDGGAHWQKEKDLADGVKNIFIDPFSPANDRTLYVAGNHSIARRQSGEWQVNKGPESESTLGEISAGADADSRKFYIYSIPAREAAAKKAVPAIYLTGDGGISWEQIQQGLLSPGTPDDNYPEWRTIATSAQHPNTVYVSYHNLKADTGAVCSGVAKSEDYGKTWKLVWKDVTERERMEPSPNFSSDWINDRFGTGWGENPLCLGVSATDASVCYATDMGRTVRTLNGGKSWEQVYSKRKEGGWSSNGLEVTTGYRVVFDPFDGKHVFMANTDIGLLESKDGGDSWLSATKDNGIPREWENTCYWIVFDSLVKGKAWAAMSGTHDLPRPKMFRKNGVGQYKGGILITDNGGATWQRVSGDIGEAAITHLLVDPASKAEARTLYACAFGKGVYKSVDGGRSWLLKNNGLPGAEPFAWQIVRSRGGALFLVVSRRSEDGSIGNDKDGALYRSDDGAESWKRVALPEGTNGPTSLVVSERDPHLLVLSAWGRTNREKFAPDTGGGIYISKDDGNTWRQTLEKDQHISDITFDVRTNRYYACGFNGSAYYSENDGETWTRIKGYNFKWGKRVDFDPLDAEKIFVITFGGGVWHGPAKGDPNAVEDILTAIPR